MRYYDVCFYDLRQTKTKFTLSVSVGGYLLNGKVTTKDGLGTFNTYLGVTSKGEVSVKYSGIRKVSFSLRYL